jgi:hypothetical protein
MSIRRQAIEPSREYFPESFSNREPFHRAGDGGAPIVAKRFPYRAMQQVTMRQPRPLRWIEEAEAREVVTMTLSEAPLSDSPCRSRVATTWRALIRGWASAPTTVAVVVDNTAPDAVLKPFRR